MSRKPPCEAKNRAQVPVWNEKKNIKHNIQLEEAAQGKCCPVRSIGLRA